MGDLLFTVYRFMLIARQIGLQTESIDNLVSLLGICLSTGMPLHVHNNHFSYPQTS